MTMTVSKKLAPVSADGPDGAEAAGATARPAQRDWMSALARGARCACPACGAGRMFSSYLKVSPYCPACAEELYHHRADDAPPYAVIFVVGHIVVPLMVIVEELYRPPVWLHLMVWMPLTLVLSLVLLPPLKAMLVNLQWALRMHGFDPASPEREGPPEGTLPPAILHPAAPSVP